MDKEQKEIFCGILKMIFPIEEKIRLKGNSRICYYENLAAGREVDIFFDLRKGCKTKTKFIPELKDKINPPKLTLFIPSTHPIMSSIELDHYPSKKKIKVAEFDIELFSKKKYYCYKMEPQNQPSNEFLDELIIDKIDRIDIKPNEYNEYNRISNEKLNRLEHNIRLWKIKSIKEDCEIFPYIKKTIDENSNLPS